MSETFGEMLKRKLIESGMLPPDHFQGCTDEEIAGFIKAQKVKRLPKVYREYLAVMGKKGLGSFAFISSSWQGGELIHLKNAFLSEIEEFEYDFRLPEDAFVFFCHGGAEYHYFLTADTNNDPPVFLYISERPEAEQIDEHLSQYYLRKFHTYQRLQEKALKSKD